jgi:UDP-N-acetylmuramoylalanine--D-glutamate ligase
MILSALQNKRVAIWGMGKEGKATHALLKKHFPDKDIIIINRDKPDGVDNYIREADIEKHLNNFDVVIKSPGISYYHEMVGKMRDAGIEITSATNIWFAMPRKGKIVAITGSNGKSTTSALLHHILAGLGLDAELGGNIGKPLLSLRDNADYYVVELSSYQTCDLHYAPDIAVVLNLHPEHLQWHRSHAQYYHDKCNLLRRGAPINIVNANEPRLADTENKVVFNSRNAIYFEGGMIYNSYMPVGGSAKFPLLGDHNLENLCATLTVCQKLELVITEALRQSYTFTGLRHRLQIVGPINGHFYVNDSISTDPEASIAALKALHDKQITLLLGGEDRKQDYSALCKLIDENENVNVICSYTTGPRIYETLNTPRKEMAANLEEAVKKAKEITPEGGYILLSPASPSYDAFHDFEERGDLFLNHADT